MGMQSGMRTVSPLLFWAGMLLLGAGLVVNSLWQQIAPQPTLLLAELALGSAIAAFLIRFVLRCTFATALMVVWLIALVCFAGVAPSAAAVLISLAALGLGSFFVPSNSAAGAALSLLAGFAVICGIDGWLLPFMIHTRIAYVMLLLIIVAVRWQPILGLLRSTWSGWTSVVSEAPRWCSLTIVLVGAVSINAWLPSMLYDTMVYHLALQSQVVHLGYYQMNVGTSLWALAPWAADILQAVGWIVAGAEARGAIDVLWFVAALMLLWELCRELGLAPMLRWLGVAMYATIPSIAYTLAAMQTEGPTGAVILALALLIQRTNKPTGRLLLLVALLLGLLMELKISNVMFAGPLVLWLFWRWRSTMPWRMVPWAIAVTLLAGGSSYVYAYALAGNPALPLFNSFFHSPYASLTNYNDARWDSGFHWNIIWRVVFHSSTYLEGGDGSPTLVLIGLAGSFLVALIRPATRALALVGAASLLLPLYEIQYLRYAEPSFSLLVPAMLSGVPLLQVGRGQARGILGCLWLLPLVSFMYLSSAAWQWTHGVVRNFLTEDHAAFLEHYAPTRLVSQVIRQRYGDTDRVLFADPQSGFGAELAGQAFVVGYYDRQLSTLFANAEADDNGAAWEHLLRLSGVNLVVVDSRKISVGLMNALDAFQGKMVYRVGSVGLWRLQLGQPGLAKPISPYGWNVTFGTEDAPTSATLVDASVELRCDAVASLESHIVLGWIVIQKSGKKYSKYQWATCLPNGIAHASIQAAVPGEILSATLSVRPVPSMDLGLRVLHSRAAFRRDLTAERDLSQQARHILEFHRKPAAKSTAKRLDGKP